MTILRSHPRGCTTTLRRCRVTAKRRARSLKTSSACRSSTWIQADQMPSTRRRLPVCPHLLSHGRRLPHRVLRPRHDDVTAEPSPNTPAWVNHIALRVDSVAALGAAKARLEAAGVEVLGITDHHIIESIYFFDPNGIRLDDLADGFERRDGRCATSARRTPRSNRGRARSSGGSPAPALPRQRAPPARARWMPERVERRLAAIDVKPGAALESQSGLQMLRPRIYGAYEEGARARSAPAPTCAPAPSSCTRPATSWATT